MKFEKIFGNYYWHSLRHVPITLLNTWIYIVIIYIHYIIVIIVRSIMFILSTKLYLLYCISLINTVIDFSLVPCSLFIYYLKIFDPPINYSYKFEILNFFSIISQGLFFIYVKYIKVTVNWSYAPCVYSLLPWLCDFRNYKINWADLTLNPSTLQGSIVLRMNFVLIFSSLTIKWRGWDYFI